jgi:hypothetical protein
MSINPTLQNSAFLGNNDFTWWLGTVENPDDRDAKLGRVRVKILGFHDPFEKPENLPWALVLQPTTNAAVSGIGNAANSGLKAGSFVMGFFLDYPDCQQPVVMGSFYSQIRPIFAEPGTLAAANNPGIVNSVTSQESKTGQPQDSERTNDAGGLASDSVAAASLPASPSNPSGNLGATSIADGKDGPVNTIVEDIKRCIEGLGNIFKTGVVYNPNAGNPTLTRDLSIEENFITVSNVAQFPPIGRIKIGSETITYNGKNEKSLVNIKRGADGTKPAAHTAGTSIRYIKKTDTPIEIYGKFTNKVVDLKRAVDRCIAVIRNLIWYIVNKVKSWLMEEVTRILNSIGLSASSPIPYFVKTLTEVVVQVLKTISCTIDEALVDALMKGIEGFIEEFVEKMARDLIDLADKYIAFAEECINNIFGSIFEIVAVGTEIANAIKGIIDLIKTVGNIGQMGDLFDSKGFVNANMLANIGNIVSFILNLLGVGCNRTTESPLQIDWNECALTGNNCNPFNFRVTNNIAGKWNPEYSKQFVQASEAGHLIMMDDTPYNNRLVIEAGGSRTGFQVDDDGNIRVTNSNNKVEVTFGKQEVNIMGDAHIKVKGNYHLKVGGNYHLEVDGQYNVFANRESKVTYNGEHETIYSNDAKLSAANGLAIAASKIGLSAGGQLDMHSPTFSTYCTEQNHLCTGSWNLFSMYENKYIGLNKFCLIGGNRINLRAGTNTDIGTGLSNKFQAAAENVWKGGLYNTSIMGTNTTTRLGIDNDTTVGATTKTKLSTNLESVTGAMFTNTTGLCTKSIEGVLLDISAALAFREGPAIFDT